MADSKKPALIKITTERGVAKFPFLNEPDTKFNKDGEFRLGVILPEDTRNMEPGKNKGRLLTEMINEAADKAFEDAKLELEEKINSGELKGEKLAKAKQSLEKLARADLPYKAVYDEEGNETGMLEFRLKMKAQRKDPKDPNKVIKQFPKLFDAGGKEFPRSKAIWGGSEVKGAGSLTSYYIPGTGLAGVGIRLAACQVLKLRQSGGDASSYGFGAEEGYEYIPDGDDETTSDSSATESSDTGGGDDF